MLCPYYRDVPLAALALLIVLACTGCADSTSLCEARLTPINLNVAPVAAPQSRVTHP